jgi:hypothetical protein
MNIQEHPYMSVTDLTIRWKAARSTVLSSVKSGKIFGFKPGGGTYRICRACVEEVEGGGPCPKHLKDQGLSSTEEVGSPRHEILDMYQK